MPIELKDLQSIICHQCSIKFYVEHDISEEWRKMHKTFFCPNNHAGTWPMIQPIKPNNELDSLRNQVKTLGTRVKDLEAQLVSARVELAEVHSELEVWRPREAEVKSQ